jgi:L-seryl-tRNA(Ser) seleniumtransferase
LLVVHDLGSGAVVDLRGLGLPAETTVQESIAAGVDVVAFSGDKLLGGPQSGLLAGRAGAIDRLRRHPLLRALRLDKLTLAALEATLRLHCDGVPGAVPVLRKMGQTQAALQARAERLVHLMGPLPAGWSATIGPTTGFAGGGTLPDTGIPSIGVSLQGDTPEPERLKSLLRGAHPPVVGRIAEGVVLLDMLTVDDGEMDALADAVRTAITA